MSGSITMTGVTGNATLSRLILDSAATRHRLDTLTNQASTGLVADNYAGLGTGAPVSLALHPQIANMQTWQNNVDAATGRMSVAQSALTEIQSIGAYFYAQLATVQGVNASAVDTIAASARDALGQVASAAEYPGWRRLRVRRPGYRQPAGARSRQYHRWRSQARSSATSSWPSANWAILIRQRRLLRTHSRSPASGGHRPSRHTCPPCSSQHCRPCR